MILQEGQNSTQPQDQSKRKTRMNKIRQSIKTLPVMKKTISKIQQNAHKLKQSDSRAQLQQQISQFKFQDVKNFEQKYQLQQKLGEGCHGVVKKCYHNKKNMHFAVKKLHYEDQQFVYLKQSFHYIHDINHPNIIKYHSIYMCPSQKACYLIMELFNHPVVSEAKNLNQQDIKLIVYQLISAVVELHKRGICHRDIKCDNILYDQTNKLIKIIDFGISRIFKNRTLHKQLLTMTGTLFYRAPEMFSGTVYDQLVDQWAIGITIYELITGKTPFQSVYVGETIDNIRKKQVYYDDQIWNSYSKGAKDLVIRFLKDKQDRMSAQQALKHFWFTHNIMAHEKINIQKIQDDSSHSLMKIPKRKVSRSITMKGDGNGIWDVLKNQMQDSKKLVKDWSDKSNGQDSINKIYESDEQDEEKSYG